MKKILIVTFVAAGLVGCNKDKDKDEFDRKAMLTNMASAVIKPSINNMAAELEELNTAAASFATSTNVSGLNSLKTAFIEAYKSFQLCKMFDFGPMMDYGIKASMNTYPTDTLQIQNNITSGSYSLTSLENVDAIGFPALDFLLYYNGETAVLSSFTSAPDAANRLTYLTDLTAKMKTEFNLVVNGWSSYESSFVNADGNDVSSSTSQIFNELLKDMELLKNAKIGIPAGEFSGGMPLPGQVEAFYSGYSIELALENLSGLKNAFLGGSGIGFDDYIRDVEGEDVSPSLADNILDQFEVCKSKIMAIDDPLSEKVISSPILVNQAFLELKKLVTYCKTDMSSTLGLLITYQDNDGD